MIYTLCFPLFFGLLGLGAIFSGGIKITENRHVSGSVARILGGALFLSAFLPLVGEELGALVPCIILPVVILVGLLFAETPGSQKDERAAHTSTSAQVYSREQLHGFQSGPVEVRQERFILTPLQLVLLLVLVMIGTFLLFTFLVVN